MSNIQILIISDLYDFATDFICLELYKRKARYLRLNRDEFNKYKITLDVSRCLLIVTIGQKTYRIKNETLRTVYYRAPVFLRDIYKPGLSKEEQLYRTQWMAFIKNLLIFDKATWINNPVATYMAENKLLQLSYSQQIGFECPKTIVTNDEGVDVERGRDYIVKSIDTAIIRINNKEAFVYSNKVKGSEINQSNLSLSPVTVQDYISPKIDIRVTVIGTTVYAAEIKKNGSGVPGDWRKMKDHVSFISFKLPNDIQKKCIKLTKKLGLHYGAIDLIRSNNKYYFIEINPTGEWAWLVESAKLPIHKGICDFLVGNS